MECGLRVRCVLQSCVGSIKLEVYCPIAGIEQGALKHYRYGARDCVWAQKYRFGLVESEPLKNGILANHAACRVYRAKAEREYASEIKNNEMPRHVRAVG